MAENFEARLAYLIRRIGSALGHHVDRTLKEFALTHTQFGALAQLGVMQPDALSGATLAERNGVTAQAMSTAIAGLVDRGLADREPHPTHGRILEVRITPKGAQLLARAQTAVARAEDRALAFLGDDEQHDLGRTLRRVMRELDLYLYFTDDGERRFS